MSVNMPKYRKVRVNDLKDGLSPSRHKKEIDEAVGATKLGFNVYTMEPGDEMPWGYHYHPEHEEIFYVVEGSIIFQTEDGEFEVEEGEAFFVPEGAPQKAIGAGDGTSKVIAVGAPKEKDQAIIKEKCPKCGEVAELYSQKVESDPLTYAIYCSNCDNEVRRVSTAYNP